MSSNLITVLYRGLLRAVDSTSRLYPTITHISIREPVVGDLAAYNSHATTGAGESCTAVATGHGLQGLQQWGSCDQLVMLSSYAEYLLESAEAIVPGLEVPPAHSPLSWKDVKRLIK